MTDVQITSPEPCVIAIYFVMEGGRLPNATEREELTEYISGENLRPLCDKVVCVEPEEVPYNIAFTYWIGDGDPAQRWNHTRKGDGGSAELPKLAAAPWARY